MPMVWKETNDIIENAPLSKVFDLKCFKNKDGLHIITDNGYAWQYTSSETVFYNDNKKAQTKRIQPKKTVEQLEIENIFENITMDEEGCEAVLSASVTSKNSYSLRTAYNIADTEFRAWVNKILAYCGQNAMVTILNRSGNKIKLAYIYARATNGQLLFYGEYIGGINE